MRVDNGSPRIVNSRIGKSNLTVGHDDRVPTLNRLICDGCSEVNGQQHRVLLPPRGIKGSFKKHCNRELALQLKQNVYDMKDRLTSSIVKALIGQCLRIPKSKSDLIKADRGEAPLIITYNFLIELTTALVKGEQEVVAKAIAE